MRKVLLTVMMVSSLLAFNACKKDGATGPAGPAGPTGATGAAGAAGAVGAAGAKGADGTKILTGAAAPTGGVDGDFYLQKTATTTVLWGPKAAGAWPATGTSLMGAAGANGATGATGATGAVGAAGNQFLAGTGVPDANNPTNAKEGDFYFNTQTSTLYGPKMADGTWASSLPISSSFTAKTYVITKGFENIVETTGARSEGQSYTAAASNFNLFTTFKVTATDMIRIQQYPGWINNRQMAFETAPGSGVFTAIPAGGNTAIAGHLGTGVFVVGAKFKYVANTAANGQPNPSAQFDFTQSDLDRLTIDNGNAYSYLTFATAQNISEGTNLVLALNKTYTVANDPSRFYTTYRAVTMFDLPTLVGPSYEKYKQDGKVYVKYKYFTAKTATAGNTPIAHPGTNSGWIDITAWANAYVPGTGTNGYDLTVGLNPFTISGTGIMGGTQLGTSAFTFAPSNTATPNNVAVATTNYPLITKFEKGQVVMNWDITSGALVGNVPTTVGDAYYNTGAGNINVIYPGVASAPVAGNSINVNGNNGGLNPVDLAKIRLTQLQVMVIPADVITAMKAKGINVDNINEVSQYIKL